MSQHLTIHASGFDSTGVVMVTDSGDRIENRVTEATVRMSVGQPTTVELEIVPDQINIEAMVAEVVAHCPVCAALIGEHRCDD